MHRSFLFPLSIFLSALLLFSMQPMVAKALLPLYGGTPAVWIVCMLFFQIMILSAYSYAWGLSRLQGRYSWRLIHTLLMVLCPLFLTHVFSTKVTIGSPEWSILYSLVQQLGIPLLLLGASAPLLQFAFSRTDQKRASDPYFLYVASNLGSLIALLSYPWIIERFLGLQQQFYCWNGLLLIYLVVLSILLWTIPYQKEPLNATSVFSYSLQKMVYWICLSFIPCSLLMGVTLYITTDVAAMPLFWVIPLALYLLSFVITFRTQMPIIIIWLERYYLPFLFFMVLSILIMNKNIIWQMMFFHLLTFFSFALLCHHRLFITRPPVEGLTVFYWCLAVGGVLAGLFNSILAPHWFNNIYEYPIALTLSIFIIPCASRKGWWISPVVGLWLFMGWWSYDRSWPLELTNNQIFSFFALIMTFVWYKNQKDLGLALGFILLGLFLGFSNTQSILIQERNFYGVKKILNLNNEHLFVSQSTIHGLQNMSSVEPLSGLTSYYGAIEAVIKDLQRGKENLAVTFIGLGAGTTLCQFRSTDYVTVVEIDQQVIDLASDPRIFTYLRDCPPRHKVIHQDGRIAVEQLKNSSQDLIILDAFNSDAIPAHLLTLEAFKIYSQKLTFQGGILVHITNRYLRLLPVLNAIAERMGFKLFTIEHPGNAQSKQAPSKWVFLTHNATLAEQLSHSKSWHCVASDNAYLWTDDYSNIIPLLK